MGDITNRLLSVKGMGYGRLEVILKEMNGKEGLVEVLKIGDVSRLASIEGISERMAVDLVLSYRGDVFSEIKGNEPAMTVATTVQQTLSSYMHTSNSRNKVLLMRPGGDLGENRIMSLENHRKKELLEGKDRAGIEKLLSLLDKTPRYRKRAGSLPYILVVEDEEAYDGIREKGLDSRCLVVSPEELTNSLEGTIILIHNRREIDEEMLPITASVHYSRPSFE
ncbi:MAG: hypothetical protein U9R75_01995, partial [Candidatus Thermoplasmatota archaeon]|nr:hypothetical protein [Candidatus Thermoplasmatota archaeon]